MNEPALPAPTVDRHDQPLIQAMAAKLCAFRGRQLDEAVLAAARPLILDLVAVTLSGSATEVARRMRAVATPGARGEGEALVYGTTARASALEAALANGTAAHAEDYDDFNEAFGGHPTVAVLPALLALAEARRLPGAQVLAAYVAGVEAETRLAEAVHFHHYEKGWHPTSTLGVFGAAAGAAHLLGLDESRTASALGIAASLSSGIKANFGADTKPMHAGHCNRSGLLAALLAEQGFTCGAQPLEGRQGFLDVYNGPGHHDTTPLRAPWFSPCAVLEPGISIKQFPCCGSTHAAVYAAFELKHRGGVRAEDIERVDVALHPRRLPHTDNPRPTTPLEAKFSLQYITARALSEGRLAPAHFEHGGFDDASVTPLTARVHASAAADYAARDDRGFAARVAVTLRGGEQRVREHLLAPGRGPDNPMSEAELRTKFDGCASRVLDAAALDQAWAQLWTFEQLDDVGTLAALLAASARPR